MQLADLKPEHFAWLDEHRINEYSQSGEDGLIEAIFDRIGTANKWVMECGASDGVFFSNSRALIEQGWSAVLIEGNQEQCQKLQALYPEPHLKDQTIVTVFSRVAPSGRSSFDRILGDWSDAAVGWTIPRDLDLAVIDVDGQDYWLFNSLLKYRPRVVMVEYDPNADPDFIPPINGEGQAGLRAITKLGIGKRYWPVCATWCNVIFVQQDLVHLLVEDQRSDLQEIVDQRRNEIQLKPVAPKVVAVTSIPQLGHNVNYGCQLEALGQFGIGIRQCYGAYWHQALTEGILAVLAQGTDFVLTMDYDTLFTAKHVADLMTLAMDSPDVDVFIPCLAKREGNGLCAHTKNQDPTLPGVNLNDDLIPIQCGHFGLTLFRASALERLAKPWFVAEPDENGGWGEGHTDADMNFWLNCDASGLKVMLARHVRIGHIEYMATIPNAEDPRKTDYVHIGEWRKWAVKENEAVKERLKNAKETYA